MRVFISHSSKDKPAVERLAQALRDRGFDPWLDKWEIGPGDDIVAKINAGLEQAAAGIIVFSRHTRDSRWVEAEVSYLTYARVQERKILLPVKADEDAWVPPLLRPLARLWIEETDAIADALREQKATSKAGVAEARGIHRVLISLRRSDGQVEVQVHIDGEIHGEGTYASVPPALAQAQQEFLRGLSTAVRRDHLPGAEWVALESSVVELGRQLRSLCLPGESGDALANLLNGCPIGTMVEVCVEAEGGDLLALPFEALRLPDDRLLATNPCVVMFRRPAGMKPCEAASPAGPLKILVAIGAPDEEPHALAVLDYERESQNILDAVETASRHENAQVRILEIGHPDMIAQAVGKDAYHVLHISCHGGPGKLILEDEDGGAVFTSAKDLIAPLREQERPIPLMLLNTCHGGVNDGDIGSLAEDLLRAGVPAVLAMQAAVSDYYAVCLARKFYGKLADSGVPQASRALALARKELERERQARLKQDAPLAELWPEYATATLFVAGEERPLADFHRAREPLTVRPVYVVSGPVPQLRIDELIGRRRELRDCLRTLRDQSREYAGVVLTGIGGIGKSAVAGRAMQRLREDGWQVVAHAGRFSIAGIGSAIGHALEESGSDEARKLGKKLTNSDLDDVRREELVMKALTEQRIVLVLDDFEQNLTAGGDAFENPDVGDALRKLLKAAHFGRLLLTCRYPIPGGEIFLRRVRVERLSSAETRKLVLRLPGLNGLDTSARGQVLQLLIGHPRMLEFFDALVRGGRGRLPHVTQRLRQLADREGIDLMEVHQPDESVQAVIRLGQRDILLEALVDIARDEKIEEALLQVAVSNRPVSPAGLACMLAADDASHPGDGRAAEQALSRLDDLSLLHLSADGAAWVHRWTAEGLADLDREEYRGRCVRAGRYRLWRYENEGLDIGGAVEAVRNFMAGQDFDVAVKVAETCFEAFKRAWQTMSIAMLASEVLEILPEEHGGFSAMALAEARANVLLGHTNSACRRCEQVVGKLERLVKQEPEQADYQHDLSVAYDRMGVVHRDLGQRDLALEFYEKALAIDERLVERDPDRADYQRNLSVAYNRMGDVYRDLGQRELAREAYDKALAIRKRLVKRDPDRADYLRALSVAYDRMGNVYRDLGQRELARKSYEKAVAIAERLVKRDPGQADYLHILSVAYDRMGSVYRDLGQPGLAREVYDKALAINEQLVERDPDRADYRCDLSMAYDRMGGVYRDLGQHELAREAYDKALAIRKRLVELYPDPTDYLRDLSVAYSKVGDLYRELGQRELARKSYENAVATYERLAKQDPDRADYLHDLSVSYNKVGDVHRDLRQRELARKSYEKAVATQNRLAEMERAQSDC